MIPHNSSEFDFPGKNRHSHRCVACYLKSQLKLVLTISFALLLLSVRKSKSKQRFLFPNRELSLICLPSNLAISPWKYDIFGSMFLHPNKCSGDSSSHHYWRALEPLSPVLGWARGWEKHLPLIAALITSPFDTQ